ncbi:MAG TPA: hypothetical protein VMM79_01825 [Longimicrobiales bacterium]|nr:hypothetical protein [Longimicrobiales bacterium]
MMVLTRFWFLVLGLVSGGTDSFLVSGFWGWFLGSALRWVNCANQKRFFQTATRNALPRGPVVK